MTDLREFLRSRIERDLRVVDWTVDDFAVVEQGLPEAAARYFGLFSPARMRAEATERARLVELHDTDQGRERIGCCTPEDDPARCVLLRALAASYLDDKDFDMDWSMR